MVYFGGGGGKLSIILATGSAASGAIKSTGNAPTCGANGKSSMADSSKGFGSADYTMSISCWVDARMAHFGGGGGKLSVTSTTGMALPGAT